MPIRFRPAALAACAAMLALAGPALAAPTLWVVKSRTSTVYLFGTVHAIKPTQAWRSPAIDNAFRDSSEIWLEVPIQPGTKGSGQAFTTGEMQRIGQLTAVLGTTTEGPTLTGRLTPAEAAELVAIAPIPQANLDRMRPWLAATLVTGIYVRKLGLQPETGADVSLAQEAEGQGKPLHGFETVEQQLHFFADLPPDVELDYLRQTLADAKDGAPRLEALERDWLAGDDAAIADRLVDRMRTRTPQLYQRLVVDRNRRWIPEIETLLMTPGVRFVAVGDGHIVGPDGVPQLLRKDGWRVERVR